MLKRHSLLHHPPRSRGTLKDYPRMPTAPTWSPALEAQAKALYETGQYSAAQIAEKIGNGKSRNSIIGLANRRGWVNPTPMRNKTTKRQKTVRAPDFHFRKSVPLQPIEPRVVEVPEPEFLGLSLLDLKANSCRYPRGGDKLGEKVFFCGQPCKGGSWCRYHQTIVYNPQPLRRLTAWVP